MFYNIHSGRTGALRDIRITLYYTYTAKATKAGQKVASLAKHIYSTYSTSDQIYLCCCYRYILSYISQSVTIVVLTSVLQLRATHTTNKQMQKTNKRCKRKNNQMQKNKQTNAKNKQMNANKCKTPKKNTMQKKKFQESMKAAAMPSCSDVPSQYVTSAMCHF